VLLHTEKVIESVLQLLQFCTYDVVQQLEGNGTAQAPVVYLASNSWVFLFYMIHFCYADLPFHVLPMPACAVLRPGDGHMRCH
jgi:hypothetical protein